MPERADSSLSACEFGRWRIEPSQEGIPLVFGDGKYPHDPPRVASLLEGALAAEVERLREALAEAERHRIRPAVNTVRLPPVDDEPEGSGPFGW